MPLINYSGAPAAPALPDLTAPLLDMDGLRAVYSIMSPGVTLGDDGRVVSIAPVAQASGSRNFGAVSGARPQVARRQGLMCLDLANSQLSGLSSDFGGNSVLTLFCTFHFGEGATTGNIYGDFSGTRMGIELGGTDGTTGLPRIRVRSTAYIDIPSRHGWHTVAFELSGGKGRAQIDQGAILDTGAASVDGNSHSLGSSGPNDAAVLSWGYATAALVTNGGLQPYYDLVDYLLGARSFSG